MRPRRVDTSEPACTKRKMLSTNSSTSWFFTSRKYSAMVRADRATRRRTPGGSSIWPNTRAALSSTPALLHLEEEVGALTGALADAGEHRHATELRGDPADHLRDEHGLAHAGAAEQADLAALQVGGEEVDDLDAGLEHDLLRLEGVEVGGVAVDLPAVLDLALVELVDVERLADHVDHVAEHGVAHRHGEADAQCCAPRCRGRGRRWASGRWPAPGCRRSAGRPRPAPRWACRRR